jgi:hypothetical protein
MMPDPHDIVGLAGDDPDAEFVASLERWLTEAPGSVARPMASSRRDGRTLLTAAAAVVLAAVMVIGLLVVARRAGTPSPSRPVDTVPSVKPVTSVNASTVGTAPASSVAPVSAPTITTAPTPPTTAAPATTTTPATTAASATAAVGGPLPSGFVEMSITHISPTRMWVIGTGCAQGACLFESGDGVQRWTRTTVPDGFETPDGGGRVRFASPRDGYLVGNGLWSTHDSGAHWTALALGGSDPTHGTIFDLAALDGTVTVMAWDRLYTSPIDHDDFQLAAGHINLGAGPVASARIVLQHGAGWLLVDNRTVVDGLRLTSTGWSKWSPPCLGTNGPARLTASDAHHLVAACQQGEYGGEPVPRVYSSDDGGVSFTPLGDLPANALILDVASPAAGSVVVAATMADETVLYGRFPGDAAFHPVWSAPSAAPGVVDLGFTTTMQASAIVGDHRTGRTLLLRSSDGGRSWSTFG